MVGLIKEAGVLSESGVCVGTGGREGGGGSLYIAAILTRGSMSSCFKTKGN